MQAAVTPRSGPYRLPTGPTVGRQQHGALRRATACERVERLQRLAEIRDRHEQQVASDDRASRDGQIIRREQERVGQRPATRGPRRRRAACGTALRPRRRDRPARARRSRRRSAAPVRRPSRPDGSSDRSDRVARSPRARASARPTVPPTSSVAKVTSTGHAQAGTSGEATSPSSLSASATARSWLSAMRSRPASATSSRSPPTGTRRARAMRSRSGSRSASHQGPMPSGSHTSMVVTRRRPAGSRTSGASSMPTCVPEARTVTSVAVSSTGPPATISWQAGCATTTAHGSTPDHQAPPSVTRATEASSARRT